MSLDANKLLNLDGWLISGDWRDLTDKFLLERLTDREWHLTETLASGKWEIIRPFKDDRIT